jgi:Ca2+-binding RTX toxin-like protein
VHGDFQVTDIGGNDSIVAGDGNVTIIGAAGDTIRGGTGAQRIDGSAGNQSIIGGSGATETIIGGPGDTIRGGSGATETIFGGAGSTIIGGAVNTFIDATQGNESILAGTGKTTILGGAADTIQGALGSMLGSGGEASISFSTGAQTLWDNGSTSKGQDTVTNFDQAGGDRISLSNQDNINQVVASATVSDGNTTIHLNDGSTITLIGVSDINNSFFTTH